MAYIAPDTDVYIMETPLTPEYDITYFFNTRSTQCNYFKGLGSVLHFEKNSYQRVNKNTIRLGVCADDIITYNYMMFQNTAFKPYYGLENAYFYAFINQINYINNNCCEIVYQLDVMQSYLSLMYLKPTYVERMHSTTDELFENYVGEPCENIHLDYVENSDAVEIGGLTDLALIAQVCDAENNINSIGSFIDGIYQGTHLYYYEMDSTLDLAEINLFLQSYVENPDSVLQLYVVPKKAINDRYGAPVNGDQLNSDANNSVSSIISDNVTINFDTLTLGGYTPKNKKLYTFPYSFYAVTDGNGNSLSLNYEYFNDNHSPQFQIACSINPPVQCALYPCNYKKPITEIEQDKTLNYCPIQNPNEVLTLSSYPVCCWESDYYKLWEAQNGIALAGSVASNMLGAIANPSPSSTIGAIGGILNSIQEWHNASIHADIAKGSYQVQNALCAHKGFGYWGIPMSITAQQAEIIDSFFTMYGYAQKKIMQPRRCARRYWTYLQIPNPEIECACPADDLSKIKEILKKGIIFWNGEEETDLFGDFSLDNEPLGDSAVS